MNTHAPALRMVAGALLLLLVVPPVSAQLPVPPPGELSSIVHIGVHCDRTYLQPAKASDDRANCVVQDFSRDAAIAPGSPTGVSASPHEVSISVAIDNVSANAKGWQVVTDPPFMSLYAGDARPFMVKASATPTIDEAEYHFTVVVAYRGPAGYNETVFVPMIAEVQMYDFAYQTILNPVQKAGQDELVTYQLSITNTGVYPDSYVFSVVAPEDLRIAVPPIIALMPGETRVVNFTLLTPHGKVYEQGRSASITLKSQSVQGSGVYTSTASLQIRGSYIPVYWIPLILIGLISAVVVGRTARERAEIRRLEAGRPRRVTPTPRQAVLLAELRRQDRDAYKEKTRALDTVYKERVTDFREHRAERAAADREEAKKARAEYVAARKQRKLDRKAEKKAAKIAKREQKKLDKIQRKELKIKEKQLKKTRKVVEKARKKADKVAAKEAKVQAKLDAKQAKLDAKAAKAAEKEAKKAAKAAKKGEGK